MNVIKNKLWIVLVALLSLNFACTQQAYETASIEKYEVKSDKNLYPESETRQEERKIIYNGSISIEVKKLAEQTKQVIEKAKAQGGCMVNSDIDRVTIRIPAEKLNSFMDEIETFGKLENRNVYSQDITDEYSDMEMRLDNAEKARKRYLELLEQAKEVSDNFGNRKRIRTLKWRN